MGLLLSGYRIHGWFCRRSLGRLLRPHIHQGEQAAGDADDPCDHGYGPLQEVGLAVSEHGLV
jgi:hypothetical protein